MSFSLAPSCRHASSPPLRHNHGLLDQDTAAGCTCLLCRGRMLHPAVLRCPIGFPGQCSAISGACRQHLARGSRRTSITRHNKVCFAIVSTLPQGIKVRLVGPGPPHPRQRQEPCRCRRHQVLLALGSSHRGSEEKRHELIGPAEFLGGPFACHFNLASFLRLVFPTW